MLHVSNQTYPRKLWSRNSNPTEISHNFEDSAFEGPLNCDLEMNPNKSFKPPKGVPGDLTV